jgi:hypothetical protein
MPYIVGVNDRLSGINDSIFKFKMPGMTLFLLILSNKRLLNALFALLSLLSFSYTADTREKWVISGTAFFCPGQNWDKNGLKWKHVSRDR